MPRKVITKHTLPIILDEIDKWHGKLTWELFSKKVAEVLSEKHVGRHTLIKYPAIKQAYDARKQILKTEAENKEETKNYTIEMLLEENSALMAKNERLQQKCKLYEEQFITWLDNIRKMPGVDISRLNDRLNNPLPKK